MAATVYFWDSGVGHAAIRVNGPDGSFDLSWHPQDKRMGSGINGPHRRADLTAELAETPPRHELVLEGLDEVAMVAWERDLTLSNYQFFNNNCAHLVALALDAGKADIAIQSWTRRWYVRDQVLVWSPQEVFKYAQAAHEGLVHSRVLPA